MVAKLDNAALDFGFTDIDIGTSLAGTTYASRAIRSPFGVSCDVFLRLTSRSSTERSDERFMPVVLSYLEPRVRQMEIDAVPGSGHHLHGNPPDAFGPARRAHALASAQTGSTTP
jgi:hypothetical protein